jgi:hypothetical protein
LKNIIFTALAILGIVVILLGAALAYYVSTIFLRFPESYWSYTGFRDDPTGLGFGVAFVLGLIGLLFALIGRAGSKQYLFWIVFIIVGLLYCLSFFGMFYSNYKFAQYPHPEYTVKPLEEFFTYFIGYFITLVPGLFLIFSGLLIKIRKINL